MIYQEENRCPCCHGKGVLNQYKHIAKGRCFKCQGAGFYYQDKN